MQENAFPQRGCTAGSSLLNAEADLEGVGEDP
jgi:hypothetical protein